MAQGEVSKEIQVNRLKAIDGVVGGLNFSPNGSVKPREGVVAQNIGHTETALYNGAALRHIKGAVDLAMGRETHESREVARILDLKLEDLNRESTSTGQRAGVMYQDEGKSIGVEATRGF